MSCAILAPHRQRIRVYVLCVWAIDLAIFRLIMAAPGFHGLKQLMDVVFLAVLFPNPMLVGYGVWRGLALRIYIVVVN